MDDEFMSFAKRLTVSIVEEATSGTKLSKSYYAVYATHIRTMVGALLFTDIGRLPPGDVMKRYYAALKALREAKINWKGNSV